MNIQNAPQPLGVGFTWQPDVKESLGEGANFLDFYEISPDVLCRETVAQGRRRLAYQPSLLRAAVDAANQLPLVIHGLGLSIGSANGWNEEYVAILDEFHQQQSFHWHSDHLAFLLTTTVDGDELHTGVPLPMPFTEAALDILVPRAIAMNERFKVPFLLENLTYYLPDLPNDHGWDEIAFLNELTRQSGCGLLLDLYNFHCNAVNFGFDALEALKRLRLESVIEIHLAGGAVHDGFLTDIHTREVPEPVWQILEWIAPRAPNLAGIVYEVMEPAVPRLGPETLTRQLERVRQVWDKYCRPVCAGGTYAAR
ncbi:MAG: DUF692 family protein [Acidobacteria bacterium]|nr:DUF692 family protein [Acidobacteriota bacterium]